MGHAIQKTPSSQPVGRDHGQFVYRPTVGGKLGKPIRFHDLKGKGWSDCNGDKQKGSGHKTEKMVAVYDRKLAVVDPTR